MKCTICVFVSRAEGWSMLHFNPQKHKAYQSATKVLESMQAVVYCLKLKCSLNKNNWYQYRERNEALQIYFQQEYLQLLKQWNKSQNT